MNMLLTQFILEQLCYGIFVCDLKYRDFVDLDFVSSQWEQL